MDNIDLFKFKFVDREVERKVVKKFLFDSNNDKILWIHGESGVGKTELVKYFTENFKNYRFIHINPIKTQMLSYFSTFTKELEKEKYSLPNFIIKNYKKIRDLTKGTISEINEKTKFLMELLEIGEKIFIDAKGDFFSTANVITRYVIDISRDRKSIFIFDNFQQCDTNSLEIIQEITNNLLRNVNIKFIFITTDNTLSVDSEIIKFLLDKIPSTPVLIKPFAIKEYFLDILLSIYSLDNVNVSDLEQLFIICNGIPEKLKTFLRNMYLSNGIEYYKDSNQARLMPKIFKETLCKGVDNTDLDSLDIIEKLVFKIIICWNETMPIFLLDDMAQYISREALCLPSELKTQIINAIYKLIGLNILELDENGLKVKHDLLYLSFLPKYNVIPEIILYNKLYNYLNINREEVIKHYSQTFFEINNALYSYKACISLWQQINLSCLKRLLEQSDFKNIDAVINRLETNLIGIDVPDLLLLAECFYNRGKYYKARNILNYAQGKLAVDTEYFRYYYLSGKLYNMVMDKENAEKELILAQKYVLPKTDEEILIKHMLQLILVEVNGRKQEAKEIFCSVSEHLENYKDNSKVLGILLKNCSNYYNGKKALNLLETALRIGEENNDLIEIAFIKNNMGYEYFKLNDYEKCKALYEESISTLSQTKIHESAYPLSNLAICYMIEDKYSEAITLINRALFWNCSTYLEFVLNTHLMLCCEQIGEKEESYKIAEILFDKLESGKIEDPVILRKVYLNLAINYDRLQLEQRAKTCIEKAYAFSLNSSSEYRASKIYSKYFGPISRDLSEIKDQYRTKYYFDHWLTIFSHD